MNREWLRRGLWGGAMVLALATATAGETTPADKTTVWSGRMVLEKKYEVPEGYALKIEPGTVIEMTGYWESKIVVKGTLEAVGTKDKRIEFRAKKPGYWGGIFFDGEKAGGRVEQCFIENGRLAAIHCNGASPVIRNNEMVTTQYGQGWIFCEKGAHPLIEGNAIEGAPTGVLCDGSWPEIKGNTFKNCWIGIRLFGFKAETPRPTIGTNSAEKCQAMLFDEQSKAGDLLKKAFESEEITRAVKLTVEKAGKGEEVVLTTMTEGAREVTTYKLGRGEKGYELTKMETKTEKRLDYPLPGPIDFAGRGGVSYRVITTPSGGGLMGREGCMDTQAGFVVMVGGEGKDATAVWHSEKFSEGQLLTAAADLNGDGVKELVVADGRWCKGKGRVYVFEQGGEGK